MASDGSAAPASSWDWAIHIGGPGIDDVTAIARAPDRGLYVAGDFSLTATFPSRTAAMPMLALTTANPFGTSEAFVARYEADGSATWVARTLGAPNAIAVHTDGTIRVAGEFFGSVTDGSHRLAGSGENIVIASLDPTGALRWAVQAGGADANTTATATAAAIAIADDGSTFVTGSFVTTATFGSTVLGGAPGWHGFLAKVDPNGKFLWARELPSGINSEASALVVANDGAICIAGYGYGGTADFGSGPEATPSGIFVVEYEPEGAVRWTLHAAGGLVNALAVSGDNSVYVAGQFSDTLALGGSTLTSNGASDVFLARLDPMGQVQTVIREGGVSDDYATSLAVARDGSALLGGHFYASTTIGGVNLIDDGFHDLYLARYDSELGIAAVTQVGGVGYASPGAIVLEDPDTVRSAYVGGVFGGTVKFDNIWFEAFGPYPLEDGDAYLAKYR